MPPNPKQIREVDKDYKAFIEKQPCLIKNFECYGKVV